jgi:hypothetical protein
VSFDLLNLALKELGVAMQQCDAKLIIGGGFGLFLLQSQFEFDDLGATLIKREAWCVSRATADFDIFLETTVVASIDKFKSLRKAIDELGYVVISGVEYLHFEKYFTDTGRVELNFLTGPVTDLSLVPLIKVQRPRVRPKGDVLLHAYLADEAINLSDHLLPISKRGSCDFTNLFVPHPAALLAMKLHAFRDRLERGQTEKAGHHAVDVYRIVCMLDESLFAETKALFGDAKNMAVVASAALIVQRYFSTPDQVGFSRIREHSLYRSEFALETLRSVLIELLVST